MRKSRNKDIICLIPEQKKGFFRLIFSRFGVFALLLLLEIIVLFSLDQWFSEKNTLYMAAHMLFSVGMVLYLFNCEMDATGKLSWMILIMLFPLPSTVFLWFSQHDVGHRKLKRTVTQLISETRSMLSQDESVIKEHALVVSGTDDLCRYINHSGCFPIYENTDVSYYASGEEAFDALLEALSSAERFIFLEFFIIDEGEMWGRVLKILADKVAEGVEVRLLYDGMCEMSTLTADYPERLAKLGIKAKPFSPIKPFLSTYYNYRDHRKVLVIDGKIAFTGGVNLADEYINLIERFGYWKDCGILLRGDAAASFTLMFLQMWNIGEQNPDWGKYLQRFPVQGASGYVMPYADIPLDDDKVGENVYMDILYRARSYVHIMTPYLILDNEMETALKYAAERGVDVKLILPGIPDKKIAYALAKTHYSGLTRAGVRIYEYTPGFMHSKVFVSDGEKAVVGTINLDYRSLYHHFECAAYLYQTDCITQIEHDFQESLKQCREVTEETIRSEKIYYKVSGTLMKLIAPLL